MKKQCILQTLQEQESWSKRIPRSVQQLICTFLDLADHTRIFGRVCKDFHVASCSASSWPLSMSMNCAQLERFCRGNSLDEHEWKRDPKTELFPPALHSRLRRLCFMCIDDMPDDGPFVTCPLFERLRQSMEHKPDTPWPWPALERLHLKLGYHHMDCALRSKNMLPNIRSLTMEFERSATRMTTFCMKSAMADYPLLTDLSISDAYVRWKDQDDYTPLPSSATLTRLSMTRCLFVYESQPFSDFGVVLNACPNLHTLELNLCNLNATEHECEPWKHIHTFVLTTQWFSWPSEMSTRLTRLLPNVTSLKLDSQQFIGTLSGVWHLASECKQLEHLTFLVRPNAPLNGLDAIFEALKVNSQTLKTVEFIKYTQGYPLNSVDQIINAWSSSLPHIQFLNRNDTRGVENLLPCGCIPYKPLY